MTKVCKPLEEIATIRQKSQLKFEGDRKRKSNRFRISNRAMLEGSREHIRKGEARRGRQKSAFPKSLKFILESFDFLKYDI
jgi:hypothetical protein